MDINNTGKPADIQQVRPDRLRSDTAAGRQSGGAGSTTGADSARAEVSLSAQAQRLLDNPGALDDGFSSARVAAIRDSIIAGEYHVDAEKLADSILRLERELGFE